MSNPPEWTPGPWYFDGGADWTVYGSGGTAIAEVYTSRDDAALMTAARDMLDTLKAIDAMPYYGGLVPPTQVEGMRARYHKALDLARAALAKARGES